MTGKMLPVGIDDFGEIRQDNYYYVDKTGLIEDLLNNRAKISLFTRPRRFGKTLNMSMLRYFFEVGTDETIFSGLKISKNKALCDAYMGKYPVIFLSLKDVDGLTYTDALDALTQLIGNEAARFAFLQTSEKLSELEKEQYLGLIRLQQGKFRIDKSLLLSSLKILSKLLYHHFGRKTVILIDEYDVPLDKAFTHGFYGEMAELIRGLFGQAFKTNDSLSFAVLTGCLRVSKESIFTGLNNFKVFSVEDSRYDEEFGFTDHEVKMLLADYNLQEYFHLIKEWYDGYQFGDADIYCPWDVINYIDDLTDNSKAQPKAYWINSSGNDLVRRFIDRADTTTREELEQLIAGEAVVKRIRADLTYDEIDRTIDNMWSVLFTTGYLTRIRDESQDTYRLMIPNKEVREVFVFQIREWFDRVVVSEKCSADAINRAFLECRAEDIQRELTMFLGETISIMDTKARHEEKENFYHGILLGILKSEPGWAVRSNEESGDGFADILIKPKDPDQGIVIELKYAQSFDQLDSSCERALNQIKERRYDDALRRDGRGQILAYGIAFHKKRCRVMVEKL